LSGGTGPGAPIFWTGRNRWIAWGQVVLHASVSDLFEETLDPGDPRRYALRGGWREVDRVVESIAVRGEPDETLEILESRNGPLLGAVHPDDARLRSLALRWTGQDRRSGMDALLRLQHAQDWQGFRHALRRLSAPPATFLYADRAGRIGLQLAGHLPLRAIETGLLPVPGRSRYYDWRGFVPFKELPHQFGSQLPFLVASTRPEMPGLPHPVTWLWHPGRAEARLRELLESSGPLDLERVLAIQRDVSSGQGRDRVRRLLDGVEPRHAPAARVRELLLAWDGGTDPDAVGAAVYHVFRDSLARLLLAERVGEELEAEFVRLAEPFPGVLLDRFVERAAEEMGGGELAERALEETWKTLEVRVSSNPRKWTWGRVHRLRLRHDFEALGEGPVAWLGRRLGRGPFPAPGDADSIWTMYHRELPGSGILVGPAFRYAVALDDPAHARFGLAGGQSGHPGSVHYDDALADWLRGRARPLWTHRADVADHEQSVWELRPRHGP
ncbi:MAG: penicillin acylase family protein, partial [Myxococcota bacterium]